jgi:hypothetical protein
MGPAREKQLLCMARAILKRSKILVMDEVCASLSFGSTVQLSVPRPLRGWSLLALQRWIFYANLTSVDYATDELIGKTIRQ